jgi:hypothetical protein
VKWNRDRVRVINRGGIRNGHWIIYGRRSLRYWGLSGTAMAAKTRVRRIIESANAAGHFFLPIIR